MITKKLEKNLKSEKAITLIALVITIIVLLILAGISISMLTGQNGILKRAGQAKNETGEKQIQEQIKLAYISALSKGNGTLTEDNFKDELKTEFGESKVTDSTITKSADGKIWTVEIDGVTQDVTAGSSTLVVTSNLKAEELEALEENGIAEITGDDITNKNLKDNDKIKAVITGKVPLTTEMTYVTGTKDTGVVVSINGSEFVWVPVPVATTSSAPSTTGVDLAANPITERPMAILQNGSDTNYQGVLYDFSGTTSTAKSIESVTGTSGYREPAEVTDNDGGECDTVGIALTGENGLQAQYNSMVASVAKYGGFYVGRYELGLEGTNLVSKPASDTVITATAANSNTSTWYGLYSKCKSYSVDNLTSTMIWGSQYDAMMNWMAKTGTNIGTIDGTNYNLKNTNQTTGSRSTDIINNVYDLYGCHFEWSLEALSTYNRVERGGSYGNSCSPGNRSDSYPGFTDDIHGSRLTLYIK